MQQQQPSCKICHDEEGIMYKPCLCTGSIENVHRECLLEWVRVSNQDHCSICGSVVAIVKPKITNYFYLAYKYLNLAIVLWVYYIYLIKIIYRYDFVIMVFYLSIVYLLLSNEPIRFLMRVPFVIVLMVLNDKNSLINIFLSLPAISTFMYMRLDPIDVQNEWKLSS